MKELFQYDIFHVRSRPPQRWLVGADGSKTNSDDKFVHYREAILHNCVDLWMLSHTWLLWSNVWLSPRVC